MAEYTRSRNNNGSPLKQKSLTVTQTPRLSPGIVPSVTRSEAIAIDENINVGCDNDKDELQIDPLDLTA